MELKEFNLDEYKEIKDPSALRKSMFIQASAGTGKTYTITGIIKSNSFMNSMQAYADIEDVNKIIEMPEGGYSMFSIYLRDKKQQTKEKE